jgi:hypothetical protein
MTLKAFKELLTEQAELARLHQQCCDICAEEGETDYARQRRRDAYTALLEVDEQIAIALEAERAAENDAARETA